MAEPPDISVDPRTIAAVRYACHRADGCRYPACDCALPIAVREGLAGAAEYDAAQRQRQDAPA